MNNRFLLYAAYGLVIFMIWQQWTIENSPVRSSVQSEESISSELNATNDADIPEAGISKAKKERKVSGNNAKKGQFFKISNSGLRIPPISSNKILLNATSIVSLFLILPPGTK